MKNPCVKCPNHWLCFPYGGSCFKIRVSKIILALKDVNNVRVRIE